ncbi:hypothetical protein [Methanobrevibacter sp. DSM 116169]|uniref:hypothetical protein n=1 Tax=Methanobrevibacter sp. DSM 116169 TaxID=3242727 RepID=UPI0038FD2327
MNKSNEEKSKFCINCGSELVNNSCPKCDVNEDEKYCVSCGTLLSGEFCSKCGNKSSKKDKITISKGLLNSPSSIIAVIATILGLSIGIICYLFFIVINTPSSALIASQITLQSVIIIIASLFGFCGVIISDKYHEIAAVQYLISAISLFFGGILLLLIPMVLFIVAAFLEYKLGDN